MPAGPTGAARTLPASLLEDGSAWRVKLHLAQAGAHRVAVSLGGAHVGSSPFVVQAEPAVVCLAASAFEGAGLQQVRPFSCIKMCPLEHTFGGPMLQQCRSCYAWRPAHARAPACSMCLSHDELRVW